MLLNGIKYHNKKTLKKLINLDNETNLALTGKSV